ncbi:MAG: transglutaminase-like domain-containing protein [Chitinophagaceae bacterium]
MPFSIKDLVTGSLFFYSTICMAQPASNAMQLSDAPDSIARATASNAYPTYTMALLRWKNVRDVNNWISANFRYSLPRAKQLAANSTNREQVAIYTPAELYAQKTGVCVDLSRFTVETLKTIDSSLQAQYLLIEFEPVTIDGSVLKNHWLTIYQTAEGYFIMADSKRPGYIAGPYKQPADFIAGYEAFRNRKIVSWKVLPSYQKKKKQLKVQDNRLM